MSIQPHWKHEDPESGEDVILLLTASVIFMIGLAAVLAFYQ